MSEGAVAAIDDLRADAFELIERAADLTELDQVRVQYLGKSGLLTAQLKALGTLPKEERPAAGQAINQIKVAVQEQVDARREALERVALEQRLAGETS